MSESKMTAKLAKETVRASFPKACCRFGWITIDGARKEFYEIFPSLRITGDSSVGRYKSAQVLGKSTSMGEAWKDAAQKLISKMGAEVQ